MASASRRKPKLPAWAHTPFYAAVRLLAAGTNIAGIDGSVRAARRLADVYARSRINRSRLERAIDNISWCFPEWDHATAREYAIKSYRHLFCLAAEVALTPRLLNEDGFATHVELGELKGSVRALCGSRPCILITGHCGNWELLGYTVAMLGFPMHALYRPLDLAPLNRWVHDTRSRRGLELIDKFGAAELLPPLMEERKPVAFIADQNAGDRGIFVPFFNRLASAYKSIGLLAMRYEADVICGQARRLAPTPDSQSFRYAIDIVDIIHPPDWQSQPDPLFYITARYRRAIEMMVRRAPEQYLWMHRYWKSRPPHERKNQPFPAQLREKIASLPWIDADDVQRIEERSRRDARELASQRAARAAAAPSTTVSVGSPGADGPGGPGGAAGSEDSGGAGGAGGDGGTGSV